MTQFTQAFKRYSDFSGRSSRSDYWWFAIINLLFLALAKVLDGVLDSGVALQSLYMIATLCPSLALSVRRLHDADRSGWVVLVVLVPILGPLILLALMTSSGTEGENRFGPQPE